MRHRIHASVVLGLICGGLIAFTLTVNAYPFDVLIPQSPYSIHHTRAAGASEFGVAGALSSLSSDSAKQSAVSKITEAGFGWTRNEITYSSTIDYTPYDAAMTKASSAGLKTLVLLTYPGASASHDQWKQYVTDVVTRYNASVSAWEIMNEADNYLSAADYTVYLQEAHDVIKGINSSVTVVASGITSRQEATNFWDGIKAAGGWSYFDVLGLHIYHDGNPEKVNFGGGDLVGEMSRVVGDINKNGGGKKIWITEMGYKSADVGNTNQANWLARSLVMLRSVSALERLFIYRLYDGGSDSYGLLTSSLAEKPSYAAVKSAVTNLSGAGIGSKLTPQAKTTLDGFSSVSGWKTDGSSNATVTLSGDTGYSGNGMKISYNFSADSAYALVEKDIPIAGTPTAIAAWIYGDDTKNVWKFRFVDANGETYQTDLGSIASGWSYKQFSIGTDTAFVHYGGDGKIDFPIHFNSVVVDHQGGASSAEGKVDEIIAISGSADLYAYQFGSAIAWWKASGSDSTTLCNSVRDFSEMVQFATGVDCTDTPKTPAASNATSSSSSSSSSASTAVTATTKKKSSAAVSTTPAPAVTPAPVADKTKSYVRVDGKDVPPDGTGVFKLVVGVKDAKDAFITSVKPGVLLSGGQTDIKDFALIGNEWVISISSKEAGLRTATVKAGDVELATVKFTFVAPATVPEVKTVVSTPETAPADKAPVVPTPETPKKSTDSAIVILGLGGFAALALIFLRLRHLIHLAH